MSAQPRMTNNAGLNLAVAVWLAHDDYDYIDKPNYLSITTLNKPVRQIVLALRIPEEARTVDVEERIASRFGQALHGDVENVWKNHYAANLKKLGYPAGLIKKIRVNPTDAERAEDPEMIAVYTEVRVEKEIVVNGITYTVGGKLDLSIDGRLQDIKKTTVWAYQKGKGIEDGKWVEQLSGYRWLNPDKITHGEAYVQYLLLDWQRAMKRRDPTYPPNAVPHVLVPLLSPQETEARIKRKIAQIQLYMDAPETDIPHCTDEELWRSEPVYKYYAKYENAGDIPPGTRSSKNFGEDQLAAMQHRAQMGKGVVVVFPGLAKACAYCPAFAVCTQKDYLIETGQLDIGQ